MQATVLYTGELSGTLIRKDGSHRDLTLSLNSPILRAVQPESFWRKVWKTLLREGTIPASMGFAVFMQHLVGLESGPMVALVTTVGVNYMAADFIANGSSPTIGGLKYHDSGTGTVAAAIGDTALGSAAGPARVAGTGSNPSANIYRSVATIAYTGTLAVTEWGLFSAASAGTLWDRRVFAAINVVNGDSIQFTYNLTIAAGGS
jgi:hypothetical protein